MGSWIAAATMRAWALHAARTTVAATLALGLASLARLPDAYWAPITTLIVMQSSLGAAWAVSKDRLIGTVLGSFFGALLASSIAPASLAFAIGVFVVGLLCGVLKLNLAAYRFGGVTLAVVVLVTSGQPTWLVGLHRLLEVSLGIVVGLATTALWPGDQTLAGGSRSTRTRNPGHREQR
ncbi:aromatic acid exporter family protein [Cyanobium sp. LEGE 06113]|uniref:FUSC family protein n=1 Tax=Cyanobium sp. LEGE 06113 TaxID=1297573 RepID=UPI00187EF908|nr:FUSC family protein [Cyanobium sp. LEGE 06113]MBE9153784.1 FUSC family protein [Cyanobium sp. LEGE 06113]